MASRKGPARAPAGVLGLVLGGWAVICHLGCAMPPVQLGLRGTADQNNGGYAVQVFVYQLKKDTNFVREPLESFWREKGKAFESDLVAPPIDVILAPGEPKVVPVPLYAETVFIGVAADFRKPNLQDWRQIISVPGRGIRELAILVGRDGLKIETVR